jgi:hypothetical protein
LPSPASVSVTATSQASASASGTSAVTVTSDIQVAVQASATSVQTGNAVQLTATVTSAGHPDTSVNWTVNGIADGSSTVGTISTTGTDTATYTAPSAVPSPSNVSITATSIADATKSANTGVGITAPPANLVLTGVVAISPVAGATVTVYALNTDGSEGSVLGTTTSGSDGSYSVTITPAPTAPILVVATAGSYTDEVTGAVVTLSGTEELSAVVPVGTTTAAITPLTTMAAARARTLAAGGTPLSTAVDSSNIGVEQQYQIADILGTLPIAANNATAVQASVTAQREYGLVLAGIMQEAQSLGVQAVDLADALASDASDGTLDGMNAGAPISVPTTSSGTVTLPATAGTSDLQTAINTFIASANNKTNLTVLNILGGAQQIGVNTTNNALFEPNTPVLPAFISGTSGASITLGATGGTPPYGCYLASGSTLPSWLGGISTSASAPSFPCTLMVVAPVPLPSGGSPMEILPGPINVIFTDSSQPPNTAQLSFYITVVEPPPTLTLQPASCAVTVSGLSGTGTCSPEPIASATGGDSPYDFDGLGTMPPLGLSVDSGGNLSVTGAASPGTSTFPVCVVDSFGAEDCGNESVTVNESYSLTVATGGTGSGTVGVSPAGTSCGSGCYSYTSGAVVQVTATAASGSTFVGWSGACSGTGTCSVTMSQDQSVTATFNTSTGTQYTLTITTSGTGSGTVASSPTGISCPGTCSASFGSGASVTLTATPASGSTFNAWSGACTGTGACTVTMNQAQSANADFEPLTSGELVVFNGNVSGSGSYSSTCTTSFTGTISIQPGLALAPYPGGIVTSWQMSGTIVGSGSCSFTQAFSDGSGDGTLNVASDGSVSGSLPGAYCDLTASGTTSSLSGSGYCGPLGGNVSYTAVSSPAPVALRRPLSAGLANARGGAVFAVTIRVQTKNSPWPMGSRQRAPVPAGGPGVGKLGRAPAGSRALGVDAGRDPPGRRPWIISNSPAINE